MNEFDDVETALARYRPAVPSADATTRIASGLTMAPRLWRRPWVRAAAAVVVLSVPALWWAVSQRGERQAVSIADVPAWFVEDWNKRPRTTIPGVDAKADVIVVQFNDWQCPPCLQLYVALEALFADYERTHPGTIARVLLDWPWNARCNPSLAGVQGGHVAACEAAAAVRLAREHGRGDELVDWLSANRQSLDGPDAAGRIIQETKELLPGIDVEAGLSAQNEGIANDVAIGRSLRVSQTPTSFINGVKLKTIRADEVEWGIKLELARLQKK